MANRSTGAFIRETWRDHAIAIQLPEGGVIETVKTAPSRRMALGMAFKGMPEKSKLLMCKTASEMTRDERGRYDMQTSEDRVADAHEQAERSAGAWSRLDMF